MLIIKSKLGLLASLAVVSAIIVFSYNTRIDGAPKSLRSAESDAEGPLDFYDGARRLSSIEEMDKDTRKYMTNRILEVFKETWPICVTAHMNAIDCKEFIDREIITTFTDRDKYIRVIIKDKRKKKDTWYNTVVIPMNDLDFARGREQNGMIYYDFNWDGSGELATPDQETETPPILATETEAGSPNHDPNDPASDPNSTEYFPLIIEVQPILVVGATTGGAAKKTDTNPICGGVAVDPDAPNDPAVDPEFQDLLANQPTDPGDITIEGAGARQLGPWNCTGLTGYNCCLKIKLDVRDRDTQDKAIQCQLIYEEGSDKEQWWLNARGKKVFIFSNHNEFVSKIPEIVGGWPKGIKDFEQWLRDGGDPNQVLPGYNEEDHIAYVNNYEIVPE